MSTVIPTLLESARSTRHRHFFAQMGDVGVYSNGHDKTKIVNVRRNTVSDYGLPKPTAAPVLNGTAVAGTHPTGVYGYRVRWKDSDLNAISLPSASAAITHVSASFAVRVTQPGSPPSRAAFWIIERTTDSGDTWIPININETTPHGTAIATTTYNDNATDQTILGFLGLQLQETQSFPAKPYRVTFANKFCLFMLAGRVHRVNALVTNGSGNVTGGSEFNQDMVDAGASPAADLSVPADADGKSYKVSSVGGATALVITPVYAGTTNTKEIAIMGERDVLVFSEPGQPESCGRSLLGIPQNRVRVGDDGEPLMGGVGCGAAGNMYAKEYSLFIHTWTKHPMFPPRGDGSIQKLASRRGAIGPCAIKFVDGLVYSMDALGPWRCPPGGEPQSIAASVVGDWRTELLDLNQGDNYLIERDQATNTLWFFVVETGQTYPRKAYVWDLTSERWVFTRLFEGDVLATCELPDTNGLFRLCFWMKVGTTKAYFWMLGRSHGDGVNVDSVAPLYGVATSGSTTTLGDTAGTWPTTEPKLRGVPVQVRKANGTVLNGFVDDNTASLITFDATLSSAVEAGDSYEVGGIAAEYRSPRMFGDAPERKKIFKRGWILVKFDGVATDLQIDAFYDGSATPSADSVKLYNEDGVSRALGSSELVLAPADSQYIRYAFQLGNKAANDLQLRVFSRRAGKPWEVFGVKIDYDFEQKGDPKR